MSFSWNLKPKFAAEFSRLQPDQQDKIFDFTVIYEAHGLTDFSRFPGKITPSWNNLDKSDPAFQYTYSNCLWHYHVGLPEYKPSISGQYLTSDWVLHFQWLNKGAHISLVDLYAHLNSDGKFWLPKPDYLLDE